MSDVNATNPDPHADAPEPTPAGMPTRFVEQAKSGQDDEAERSRAQQGLGPFTLREWIVIALGTALVVLSFFSAFTIEAGGAYTPVWALGLTAVGAVLLPLVGVLLLVLRRFSPRLQNVGGLGIDQLCSVAFVVAALVWLNLGIILTQVTAAITGLVEQFAGGLLSGVPLPFDPANLVSVSPIVWIAFVVALAGVFFTVFARFVPPFSADFANREEVVAHSTARPARPIAKRIRQPRPAPAQTFPPAGQQPFYGAQQPYPGQQPGAQQPYPGTPAYGAPAYGAPTNGYPVGAPAEAPTADASDPARTINPAGSDDAPAEAPVAERPATGADTDAAPHDATGAPEEAASTQQPDPASAYDAPAAQDSGAPDGEAAAQAAPAQSAPATQPFWALAPVERDVHDFDGHPIYKIGPTAWALVLEDRGSYFVMRHDDGRIGYLHDVSGITRG